LPIASAFGENSAAWRNGDTNKQPANRRLDNQLSNLAIAALRIDTLVNSAITTATPLSMASAQKNNQHHKA
jgi:hypothetical protein